MLGHVGLQLLLPFAGALATFPVVAVAQDSVEVRLWGTLGLTGEFGASATNILQGLQLLAARIDATEPFRVADNRTVKLRLNIEDDGGDTEEIKRLYGEAVSNGIADLFLGPSTAAGSLEVAGIVEANDKVIMLHADPRPATYELGYANVFSVNLLASSYMADGLSLLDASGARSVALVSADDETNRAICEGARLRAEERGFEVMGNLSFDIGDLNAGLQQAKRDGVQAILGCGSLEDEALAVLLARSLGFAPASMLLSHAATPAFITTVGISNANYLLAPSTWDSRMDTGEGCPVFGSSAGFAEMYRESFGADPTAEAAQAVAAGLALLAALDGAAWPVTGAAATATALRALKMPSFYGTLAFSTSGMLTRTSGATLQVQPLPRGSNPVDLSSTWAVALLGDDNLPLYPMPSWDEKDLEVFPCSAGSIPADDGTGVVCEPCSVGHYARSGDARCRECAPGFYADAPGSESCKLCPTGADCPGTGTSEFPPAAAGFHLEGGEFWECFPEALCLGNNECDGENEGFLCAQCPTRQTQHSFFTHFIFTDWSCQECLAAPAQVTLLVLVYIVAMAYLALLSYCVLASAISAHVIHSILWKKVVSHLTLITAVMEATDYGVVSQPLGLFAQLIQNPVALIDFECFVARDAFLNTYQVIVLVGFSLIPLIACFLYLLVYITFPFLFQRRRLQFLRRMKKRQVRSEIKRQSFQREVREGHLQSDRVGRVASDESVGRQLETPVTPMASGVEERPDRRYWVTSVSSMGSSVCSISIDEEHVLPGGTQVAGSHSGSSSASVDPELGFDPHGRAASADTTPTPGIAESGHGDEVHGRGRHASSSHRGAPDDRRGSASSGSWDLMGLRQPTEDSVTPGNRVDENGNIIERRIRFNVSRHRSSSSTAGSGPQSAMFQNANSMTVSAANDAVAYASQQVQRKKVEVAGNAKHIMNITRMINKEAASICTRLSINVTYLLHPVAVRLLLQGVNCRKFDKWRAASELAVECNDRWWMILCVCGIVVYGFGIPLALMIRLYTLRNKLGSLRVRKRYGFLYNGFEGDKYYWEGYFMARKAVIIAVAVIPGLLVRAYVCLILGFCFLALQMHCNPYDNRSKRVFHHLELVSLFSVLALILMRILLVSAETVEETSPVFHDMLGPQGLSYTLVTICILSQVCFFGLAASRLFHHGPRQHVLNKSRIVPESVGPWQRCALRWLSLSKDRLEFKADTAEIDLHDLSNSQKECLRVALCSTVREYILRGPTFHVGRVISALRIATHEALEHDLDRLWRFHNFIHRLQEEEQGGCLACSAFYKEIRFTINQNTRYSLTPCQPEKWAEFKSNFNMNSVTVDDLAVTLMMCKEYIKAFNVRFHKIDRHANPNPHLGVNQGHSREGTSHGDLSQSSETSSDGLSESSPPTPPPTMPRGNSGVLDPEEVLAVPMQVVGERGDFLLRMQRPALEREARFLQLHIDEMKEQLAIAAPAAGSWKPSPLPSDAMAHVQSMSELPTREEEAEQAAAIIAERVQDDARSEPVTPSPTNRVRRRGNSVTFDIDLGSNGTPEPITAYGTDAFSPISTPPDEARTPNPWENTDEPPRPPPPMPPQPMQHGDPWEEPPEPPALHGAHGLASADRAPRQLWSPNPAGADPPRVPELERAARRQAAFDFLAASVVPMGEPPQVDHEVWLPNHGSHEEVQHFHEEEDIHGDTHSE